MRYLNLSLNPSYYCNFRCSFCYLTLNQLNDKKFLDLSVLDKRLLELKNNDITLNHIDLYGGEISLLKNSYLHDMIEMLKIYSRHKINIISNLSAIHPVFFDENVYLTVSYDFDAREKHELVFQNMLKLSKPFSILILASQKVMQMNVDFMISMFNSLALLQSVEIKPYSPNQSNHDLVSYLDYEEFVKKWLQSSISKNFQFVNKDLILDCIDGLKNAFSDDHIYLTPSGDWAVLDFDEADREYFRLIENINDYYIWTVQEKTKIANNRFCSSCKYSGGCLTEHYRDVKSLDKSCNGFKNLLDWAALNFNEEHQT